MAFTLSVSSTGSGDWGDIALVFSGSGGPGASASGTGTGAPSLAITTSGDHSAIAAIILDANAVSGTSRTWLAVNGTTPTAGNGFELGYTLVSGTYGIYTAYWPDAGLAGAKTVGLSAPAGMNYTIIATEVLGTAPPPPNTAALPVTFTLAARPAWTGAGATLAAGVSLSGTSSAYRLLSAELDAGISLAAGAVIAAPALLPAVAGVTATVAGAYFIGTQPLTYPQYLGLEGAGGTLVAFPGQFRTDVTPASGYAWNLAVPPPDGRWIPAFPSPLQPVKLQAPLAARAPAPSRSRLKAHGQRHRSAYQLAGARR